MQGTNVLFGQIAVVLGIVIAGVWAATQWTAAALGYQVRLGSPRFDFLGTSIYHPWKLFEWWFFFGAYAGGLRHRRRDCRRQRHGRRGRRHRHVGLALASSTHGHNLRLCALGERTGHSQGWPHTACRRVPRASMIANTCVMKARNTS